MDNHSFSNAIGIGREIIEYYINEYNESRILTKLGNQLPVEYRQLIA